MTWSLIGYLNRTRLMATFWMDFRGLCRRHSGFTVILSLKPKGFRWLLLACKWNIICYRAELRDAESAPSARPSITSTQIRPNGQVFAMSKAQRWSSEPMTQRRSLWSACAPTKTRRCLSLNTTGLWGVLPKWQQMDKSPQLRPGLLPLLKGCVSRLKAAFEIDAGME